MSDQPIKCWCRRIDPHVHGILDFDDDPEPPYPREPWSPFKEDGSLKDLEAEGWHFTGYLAEEGHYEDD